MTHRPAADAELLPEPIAAQLLARASELDATDHASATVAELRAAAVEAGISDRAFDAALAELRSEAPVRASAVERSPRRRSRIWLAVAAAGLLAAGLVTRMAVPTPVGAPPATAAMVDEAILLRCLAPNEASQLIRPILTLRENTVVIAPEPSRVLNVRGTPEQLERVRSVLDQYERGGSSACTAR